MKMTLPARHSKGFVLLALLVIAGLALAACSPTTRAEAGYVLVFDYQGKFIPVEQLRLAPEDACDSEHYHADGPVITLRGESLTDPNPLECGFGRKRELKVEQVLMPDDYNGVQRTDPDYEFEPDDD
jgi:hypothetical protein